MVQPRFSLRLLLLLVIFCASALGLFRAVFVEPYRQEAVLAERITVMKGEVVSVDRTPAWLWRLFGERATKHIHSIECFEVREFNDGDLTQVARLEQLEGLLLVGTKISDAGVAQLGHLKELKSLEIRDCPITKSPPVAQMSKLITLDLSHTGIAEFDVTGLDQLEYLNLSATQIDDDVVARLAPLPRLKTLDISGSASRRVISDKGVLQLTREKYPSLTRIYLYFANVTDAGIDHLKAEFPHAGIYVQSGTQSTMPAAAKK